MYIWIVSGGGVGACTEGDNLRRADRAGAVTKPSAEPEAGRGTVAAKGEE